MIHVSNVLMSSALQLTALFAAGRASIRATKDAPGLTSPKEASDSAARLVKFIEVHLPTVHLSSRSGEDVNPPLQTALVTELHIKADKSVECVICQINWNEPDPRKCLHIYPGSHYPMAAPWTPYDPFRQQLYVLESEPENEPPHFQKPPDEE